MGSAQITACVSVLFCGLSLSQLCVVERDTWTDVAVAAVVSVPAAGVAVVVVVAAVAAVVVVDVAVVAVFSLMCGHLHPFCGDRRMLIELPPTTALS